MKKILLYTIAIFMAIPFSGAKAQGIDKPIYQIVTYRDTTYLGTFTMELFPLIAPLHVNMFDSLVSTQFFDSTAFHRVVPGFVIQGGDPNSISGPISTWGQGQPWQPTVPAEFNAVSHLRGIVGAARDADPNSASSQFYICVAAATFLDGNYTVYGQVTTGMNIVDSIVQSPRDVNDVPLQKISMFVTYIGVNDTIPTAPVLTVPGDNSLNISTSQIFRWTAVPEARLYTIEFATDSLFSNIVLVNTAGVNSTTASVLPGVTTCYWRVKTNNGGHESIYSQVWKFTTVTGAASLIYPSDSATNVFVNPNFEWSSVNGTTSYQLQVATVANFNPFSLVFNQSGLTDTTQLIPPLLSNTRYYWRVRSFNGSTAGYYSAKYTFETGTTTGIISASNSDLIEALYPNPVSGMLNISLKLNDRTPVLLKIVDLQGRTVMNETYPYSIPFQIAVDVSKFSKGVYFLELANGNTVSKEKIIIE